MKSHLRVRRNEAAKPMRPFTDLEMCYFAALCEGLRIVDLKARQQGRRLFRIEPVPLQLYVAAKGKMIASLNNAQ